jgi:hypothetical protein
LSTCYKTTNKGGHKAARETKGEKAMIAIVKGKAVYTVTDFILDEDMNGIKIITLDDSRFTPTRFDTIEEAQKVFEGITETVISKGHEAVIIL